MSGSEKGREVLRDFLDVQAYKDVAFTTYAAETRRLMLQREFDLCVINMPLPDESGVDLAIDVVQRGYTQALCLVKSEAAEEIGARLLNHGVFVLSKPINKHLLRSVLKLLEASYHRFLHLHRKNDDLKQKIEDTRLIDRAKCLLISCLSMTETQAHRYIEKEAMNQRITRRDMAINLIRTYES